MAAQDPVRKQRLADFVDWSRRHITGDEKGQPVTAPGVPPAYGDAKALVTEDCIRPC